MDEDTKAAFEGVNAKLDAMMEQFTTKLDAICAATVRGDVRLIGTCCKNPWPCSCTTQAWQMRGLRS
jgi:hypothetical protein